MRCSRCDQENANDARFCSRCGYPVAAVPCAACGRANAPHSQFCSGCGRALNVMSPADLSRTSPRSYTPAHLAARILTTRTALEGEHKIVTVLFCDIVRSTALAERLEAEGMHGILNRFFELALRDVHRFEGTINQFLGDGFMALFGAPLAHEDHARRAALAALAIERTVRQQFEQLRESGNPLEIRMGLNTGSVVVGSIGDNLRMDYTAIGDTTNVAARLQQEAEPGTILVGEATARLLTGYMRLEPVGSMRVKGKSDPVIAHKLCGLGPRRSPIEGFESRRLSTFAGRDRQLADLHQLLGQMQAGRGQAVAIIAEAGMGKSRLLYEFRHSLGAKQTTYLEGRCLSFGKTVPYLPIVDILRANSGIAEVDAPEIVAEKIANSVREVGMDPATATPYLLHLFGVKSGTEALDTLTAEAIKARTFDTIRQMTLWGSRNRPLVLAVEDLHWMDTTSEECLGQLVEAVGAARIMLVCTYRPDYQPRWINRSYATQITLPPLSSAASLDIVRSFFDAERLSEDIARVILERAEGNPFFLEQLAQAMREPGGKTPTMSVPSTIQGVLMARIDRLPDETRRVLQTAAVLGREFPLRLLHSVWDGPSVPEPHLLDLKRQEFVYERADTDEPVYVFRHALTHDVAYDSLLESRREALHASAGRALEALFAPRLDEAVVSLAHHYSKAGDAPKAVEYLVRSADKAAQAYANAEAVKALQEALVFVERLPAVKRDRLTLGIIIRLARSLYFLGRNAESCELLLAHGERVERLADPALTGAYYFWLGHAYTYLGKQDEARDAARRAIDAAARANDPSIAGKAYYVLARTGIWTGRSRQGVDDGLRAIALLDQTTERLWLGQSHWVVAGNFFLVGEFDRALAEVERCDAVGDAIGDRRLRSYASWTAGLIYSSAGEWQKAIEACQRATELSPDLVSTAAAAGFSGVAYVEKGEPVQALPPLRRGIEMMTQFKFRQLLGWFQSFLADAYRMTGDLKTARQVAMEAKAVCSSASFQYGTGLAHRALGRIALAEECLTEAESEFSTALQDFTDTYARFEIGRTHLDLSTLRHVQANDEAASQHLLNAYNLFADLRASRYVSLSRDLARKLPVTLPTDRKDV
jgi:class 3 adenylate cyclase/tetratricopeptide (TPR) repeat protein